MGSWGILGRKKTCKHSLLHIQKVIQTSYLKENSQILTQLKTKKINLNILVLAFWTHDGGTVEDAIAVVGLGGEIKKNLKKEWDWLEERTCTTIQTPLMTSVPCSKMSGGKWWGYKQKECPH